MSDIVTADAVEFGNHIRSGGWRLALLVARSVSRGNDAVARARHKISAREFAKLAGTTHDRVLRYLDAWEAAAKAGEVPPAAELHPGVDVVLPDGEAWSAYYPPLPRVGTSTAEREAIAEQAEADGLSPAQVVRVASNPRAIASAILAHPKAADAAREALRQLPSGPATEHRRELREEARRAQDRPGPDPKADPPLVTALQHLIDADAMDELMSRMLEQLRRGVMQGMPADVKDEAVSQFRRWQEILGWAISIVEGGAITDEALERWLA